LRGGIGKVMQNQKAGKLQASPVSPKAGRQSPVFFW